MLFDACPLVPPYPASFSSHSARLSSRTRLQVAAEGRASDLQAERDQLEADLVTLRASTLAAAAASAAGPLKSPLRPGGRGAGGHRGLQRAGSARGGRAGSGLSAAAATAAAQAVPGEEASASAALAALQEAMEKLREDKDSVIQLRQVEIEHLKYEHGREDQVGGGRGGEVWRGWEQSSEGLKRGR